MTGRVLVTAYCHGRRGRSHALGKLVAVPEGMRVFISHPAVGHAKGSRAVNRQGPAASHALDPAVSMTYLAMCAHGVHAVHERDLTRAYETGVTVVTLRPILL